MIRLKNSPNRNQLQTFQPIDEAQVLIAEIRPNGGLVTELDPSDIESSQSQMHNNFRVNADKIERSPGKSAITPTKPNSNRILNYTTFDRFAGTTTYLRFTATKVHKKGVGSWTELTAGVALTATDSARINTTMINDRFFFANGVDAIQEINTGITAYAAAGNAPKSKYICGFFNRLVCANSDTNPVLISWSGDLNFTEFNPATDISAGSTPLIEGQSDYAEPITGLFGFASVMLILREKSLWVATKQPSASNPFSFNAAFPTSGCDCPSSAAQTAYGVTWYDQRTNNVYSFNVGSGQPEKIGTAIRSQLKRYVSDVTKVSGSYDAIRDQYILLVPSNTSTTSTLFIYDFLTKSWHTETVANCCGIFNLADGGSLLTYGDLVGTYADLVGNYSDLVLGSAIPPNRFYGLTDGDILQDVADLDTVNGVELTSEYVSKIFALPNDDINITELQLKYIPYRAGSFTLSFSRDKGDTFTDYKTITFDASILNKRRTVLCRRNLRVKEYVYKITSTEGSFSILETTVVGVNNAEKTEG